MLNESSTQNQDYSAERAPTANVLRPPQLSKQYIGLQEAIEQVMHVKQVTYPDNSQPTAQLVGQFAGQLNIPSAEAYDLLEPTFQKMGVHAYFAIEEKSHEHLITVIKGRFSPKERPWWPNAILFVLTVLSLLFVGAGIQAGVEDREFSSLSDLRLLEGWPYALSMILILGAHELGHYFAARYHKVNVTLPYFIPMPFMLFGTMGAFIQLREPMRSRRVLFDIGIAGPLAGLIFAIPILFMGLSSSNVEPPPSDASYYREGNSILYASAKWLTFGRILPDNNTGEDVLINQLAQAGWAGLFITALNLIPLGQLDGGHVIYTLFGPRVKRLFWPIIIIFAGLSILNETWVLWTVMLFLLGRFYAHPLEDITPLDSRRRILGYAALIIFVLIFVPEPLQIITIQ